MIIFHPDASDDAIAQVEDEVRRAGGRPLRSAGSEVVVIGVVGDDRVLSERLSSLITRPAVDRVVPVLRPYKLASRDFQPEDRVVRVGDSAIGRGTFALIAGVCTVETRAQTLGASRAAAAAGATFLRGGAWKPRTSPYTFQGLGADALPILAEAKAETGLPVVTEVMEPEHVALGADVIDVFQIGARSMQQYGLLREVGRSGKPVLLKRGMSSTVEEWLLAAEYILAEGNERIILCERGIRSFETATRGTLDLGGVAVAKRLTSLPIVVDPSHAAGARDYVLPLALAAVGAGADGIMVEIHTDPDHALCDGPQAIPAEHFGAFADAVHAFVATRATVG